VENGRINGYVVLVSNSSVTYVREETMFLAAPIFGDADNSHLMHVCPYIREVVERFSPIEQV
jgi:hypothetical protein